MMMRKGFFKSPVLIVLLGCFIRGCFLWARLLVESQPRPLPFNQGPRRNSAPAPDAAAAGRGEQQLWGGAGALKPVGSQLPAGTKQTEWFILLFFGDRLLAATHPRQIIPGL